MTTTAPHTESGVVRPDFEAIVRREFPRLQQDTTLYLNSAATGPLPERARLVAIEQAERRAEPWRYGADEQFRTLDRSRELIARMVGASPSEIALMVNTGYGLNLAARSLPFAKGDVVVGSARDFPANVYPWMGLARDIGVEFRQVPASGRLFDEDALLAALDAPRVRALVVSWVSFESGVRLDLARLGHACRERNIWFVVDAIQGVGPLTLDLSALPVDVLSCGTQKWLLSPWGGGFVYIREALARTLEPTQISWMSVEGSDDFTRLLDYRFASWPDARRFEMVTLPYQDFAVVNAALEVLAELGYLEVEARIRDLTQRLVDWASASPHVSLVTPADPRRRAGIVSVTPRHPVEASRRLAAAGVIHSLREGAIRLSPHVFTPMRHVDRAIELLDQPR
jgi:selenocysteine lyase/cysteine desulfurase